jgi:hypothetical protein
MGEVLTMPDLDDLFKSIFFDDVIGMLTCVSN